MTKSFNLTSEPWINVINVENEEETVSIIELFKNISQYRRLAGDMYIQDLSILRLLLAVLTTVYTRFDAYNQPYEWLELTKQMTVKSVDDDYSNQERQDKLLDTWDFLYKKGSFSRVIIDYLLEWKDDFDIFGTHPFYQVTKNEYNQFVEKKIDVKSSGKLSVRLWNRRISESNNKISIFSPRTDNYKDKMELSEFARWLVTYQSFSDTHEKSWMKIGENEKVPLFAGWLYKINPVYAKGRNLFETLMLNLVMEDNASKVSVQKPIWEYSTIQDYLNRISKNDIPDNITEIYTMPAKLLYIRWDKNEPVMFTASIPVFTSDNAFLEPMTTWREKDSKNPDVHIPETKDIRNFQEAMWRHFGQYVSTTEDKDYEPGIVSWLNYLKSQKMLSKNFLVTLATTSLISDKSAANAPISEIHDEMSIDADVLFDEVGLDRWPQRIEEMIKLTQEVGEEYRSFVLNVYKTRGLFDKDKKPPKNVNQMTDKMVLRFYDSVNTPFKEWLARLSSNDNRDQKEMQWKKKLKEIVLTCLLNVLKSSSIRDVRGIISENNSENIFTAANQFNLKLNKILK